MTAQSPVGRSVRGVASPWLLLRLEGLAVATAAVWLFATLDLSWWWFVGLFLVPDVGLLGFLADNMIGSRAYNTTHTLLGPLVLTGVALSVESEVTLALAAIWLFHCGIDRAFGYGLKYPAGPKETHLQVI